MAARSGLTPLLGLAALCIAAAGGAAAQAPGTPADWPCPQQYIPELSLAQVWPERPPSAPGTHWAADANLALLVPRIAATDRPLAEVEAEIDRFAAALAPEQRDQALGLLFLGAFELLNAERGRAVLGAMRFARLQHELAARIREGNDRLLEIAKEGGASEEAMALQERLTWDLRLFEERRSATTAVCAQPDLIEKRIFALARVIRERIGKGQNG